MTLAAACTALRTACNSLTGIRRVYTSPPEEVNEFPGVIVYPMYGELMVPSSGVGKGMHTIAIDIVQGRQSLPDAVIAAQAWPDQMLSILGGNSTLSGSGVIIWPIRYRTIPMRYGTATLYGVHFEVPVKIMTNW